MKRFRTVECEDWADFRQKVAAAPKHTVFRGQRDPSWEPESMFERLFRHFIAADPENSGEYRLSTYSNPQGFGQFNVRFMQNVRSLQPDLLPPTATDNDWMALARHHGVATDLLDWTRNPIIAAFFAYMDYFRATKLHLPGSSPKGSSEEDRVSVWALRITRELKSNASEFAIIGEGTSPRQVAQRGVFTRVTDETSFGLIRYLRRRELLNLLTRYDIPGDSFDDAFCDFEDENMSYATLFPDLYGAAEDAIVGPFAGTWAQMARRRRKALADTTPLVSMQEIMDGIVDLDQE